MKPVVEWLARTRRKFAQDIAIHWLAYLGMLLLFAGVFGLIAFSLADVRAGLRPLAELAVPTALFLSGWLLTNQRAPFAGRIMTALGGAVLPFVVIASLTDAANVPPDVHGGAFAVLGGLACAGIAASYALLARQRATSLLRFLVGPALWLGAGMVALVTRATVPSGSDIATVSQWQVTVLMGAIAASLVGLRLWRRTTVVTDAIAVAALPAAAVVMVLAVIASTAERWAVGPGAVTALAAFVVVELSTSRLGSVATAALEIMLVAAGAGALAPDVPLGWQAAVATAAYLALAEWIGWRRPSRDTTTAALVAACGAAAVAFVDPWPTIVAFALLTTWAQVRRFVAPDWLITRVAAVVAAAAAPVGIVIGLFGAVDPSVALLVVATSVAALAVMVRAARWSSDELWAWYVPLSATSVAVGSSLVWSVDPTVAVVVAAGLATVALATSRLPAVVQTWAVTLSALWTLGLALARGHVEPATFAAVFACVALALVLTTLARRVVPFGHLGVVGHIVGACTLATTTGVPGLIVLGAFTAGWAATAMLEATGGAPELPIVRAVLHTDETSRVAAQMHDAPLLLALLSAPIFALDFASVTGVVAQSSAWFPVVASSAAVVYAIALRTRVRRAATARLVSLFAFGIALLAAFVTPVGSAGVAARSALIAVVWLSGTTRRAVMPWAAWFATVVLAVDAAIAVAVPSGRVNVVVGAWGGVLLVGALAVDDVRGGRRRAGEWIRAEVARAPAYVGAAAVVAAWLSSFGQSRTTIGWWSVAMAAFALLVGWQLCVGVLSGVSAALAVVAVALLGDVAMLDRPWTLVVASAVLVAVAGAAQLWEQGDGARRWWWRWDLPSFAVAHAVATVAAVSAVSADEMPRTWISLGALSAVIAARMRRAAWWWGAAIVTLAGIAAAGDGWRVVAFTLMAVFATVAAVRARGTLSVALRCVGALSAAAAGVQLAVWATWSLRASLIAAALASALVLLVAAVLVRRVGVGFTWLAPWIAVAVVGVAWSAATVMTDTATYSPGPAYAQSLACAAAACSAALMARPLAQAWLRDLAAWLVAVATAWLFVAPGGAPDTRTIAALAAVGAYSMTVAAIALDRRGTARLWTRPTCELAALAAVVTICAAAVTSTAALALALLTIGSQLAAFGIAFHVVALQISSPPFVVAAWMLFAREALGGNPQWYTISAGVGLLAIAAIGRHDRRARGASPATLSLVVLEYAGMVFVVAAALLQTITTSLADALLAVALGALLTAWGIATEVRHRAEFGAAASALAVLLTILVPLARAAPQWRGAALWLALASIGLVAIVVAALMERGVTGMRHAVHHLVDMTKGWEK